MLEDEQTLTSIVMQVTLEIDTESKKAPTDTPTSSGAATPTTSTS